MQLKLLKYILDLEAIIEEIELIQSRTNNDFNQFSSDIVMQRAIERNLEIIGEAIKKMIEINPDLPLSSVKNIIGLRNIIAHAYDSVEAEMLWSVVQKNIPTLKKELKSLKQN